MAVGSCCQRLILAHRVYFRLRYLSACSTIYDILSKAHKGIFNKSNDALCKAVVRSVHFCDSTLLVCLAVQRQMDHDLDERFSHIKLGERSNSGKVPEVCSLEIRAPL